MKPSIIILAYNSETTIARTIDTAKKLSDDIHVVDSFSVDTTLHLARERGVNCVQHKFVNYSVQRNWAIDMLPLSTTGSYTWTLTNGSPTNW